MKSPAFWIDALQLLPHPEGGFYKETYRSSEKLFVKHQEDERNVSTAIYFLLRSLDRSAFHRICSDELWHFHEGSSLRIFAIDKKFGLKIHRLGLDISKGDQPQVVIPANTWFGALVDETNGYTLASCTVAPGFDFRDFEMADRENMLKEFPTHSSLIIQLT